jgi:hypothetical protein
MTTSRIVLLSLLIVVAIGAFYGSSAGVVVFEVWLEDGGVAAIWTAGAIGLGLLILRLLRVEATGALRIASAGGLGLGLVSLLTLGLGLAGWLNQAVMLGMAGAGLAAMGTQVGRPRWPAWQGKRFDWLIRPYPAVFLGIAMVAAAVPPLRLWKGLGDPLPYDVLEYHLQVPREWYEAGRIVPLLHNVFSFMPFNVEMHFLDLMHLRGGPWVAMYSAQYMVLAYMVLAVLAVYGVAERVLPAALRPQGAMLTAVAAATTPWLLLLGTVAYDEAGLLLYGALAIAWTLPAKSGWRDWLLGGVCAGLACGCKYTAVPMVLLAWPVARAVFAPRPKATCLLWFMLAGLAVWCPWTIRNLFWTGNPVFPEAMNVLGRAHFSPEQAERWEAAHAADPQSQSLWGRVRAFGEQVLIDKRYGPALWLGAALALALLRRRPEARALAVYIALLAVFWMGFTHLQSRFFVLAIIPASLLIGLMYEVPPARLWAFGIVAVMPWFGLPLVHGELWKASNPPTFGSLQLWVIDGEMEKLVADNAKVALVGDAMAFKWGTPMRNLKYRTVFDVDQKPGQSLEDAWLGPDAAEIRRDFKIQVDETELERLAGTYRSLRR